MQDKIIKVLFVCYGNICRSPAGENILKNKLQKLGVTYITVDSAGVYAQSGNPIDDRMQKSLKKRNYPAKGTARKLSKTDLQEYDYILVMDEENLNDVIDLGGSSNVKMLMEYCGKKKAVADPYWGGDKGFDVCVQTIEEGCDGFLQFLKNEKIIYFQKI